MQIYVPLNQLDDNPFQARQAYGDIAELAADIYRHRLGRPDTLGLQQVPVGRLVGDDGLLCPTAGLAEVEWCDGMLLKPGWRVQLEFGHRRRRAFAHLVEAGCPEYRLMSVIIRDLTDEQMLDGVWQENWSRRNLSAVEEAALLARKLETVASQREVAEAWGLARPTVSNRLRLLQLPEDIQQANRDGRLPERTCLALLDVVSLQTAVNGQAWQDIKPGFYRPDAPDEFIRRVLEKPEEVPSDDVREYVRRAAGYAGEDLPGAVASHAVTESRVRQPECKGCPARLNQTCLDTRCLALKKTAVRDAMLAAASVELNTGRPGGIDISDEDGDFLPAKHGREARLLWARVFEQRAQYPDVQFVIGWRAGYDWEGVRPYYDARDWVGPREEFDRDGRAGILVGVRGGALPPAVADQVRQEAAAAAPDRADIATLQQQQAWHATADQLVKSWERRAMAVLVEEITPHVAGVVVDNIVQALLRDPDADWLDEPEQVARLLIQKLWENGRGVRNLYSTWDTYASISNMLRRAGFDPVKLLSTGSREQDVADTATSLLSRWYRGRHWPREGLVSECERAMTELLADWPAGGGEELDALRTELRRALRDVDRLKTGGG